MIQLTPHLRILVAIEPQTGKIRAMTMPDASGGSISADVTTVPPTILSSETLIGGSKMMVSSGSVLIAISVSIDQAAMV